jgi:anti-sigma regulatory factor (Ser/Thr protein kinase)
MPAHLTTEPCTTRRYPHDVNAGYRARAHMREELSTAGFTVACIEKAELVLSELIANAIEHGQAQDDGTIEASWCVKGNMLHLSVLDGGTSNAELHARSLHDTDMARGRGLAIVNYLCESWSVETEPGIRVTAELVVT